MKIRNTFLFLFSLSFLLSDGLLAQLGRPRLSGPEFDRRFKESYNASSLREPRVSEIELAVLVKLTTMIDESPEYTRNMLRDMLSEGKPISGAFNHALGNLYFEHGEYLKAEIEFISAIDKLPSFRRAWNGLGLARFSLSDYEGAVEAMSKSVQLGTAEAMTYGILGYCYLQLGHRKSAEVAYDLAIFYDPENTEWAEGMAQVYLETDRYDEANGVFEQLIQKHPDRLNYWLLQANTYLSMEKPLKTARNIEVARRLGTLDSDVLFLLGNIYLKEGIFGQAKDVFAQALEIDQDYNAALALKAVRYLHGHSETELAKTLFEAIEASEDEWSRESNALFNLLEGDFALSEEEPEKAIEFYNRSLAFEPLNGRTLMKLAKVHQSLDQDEKAYYLYQRAQGDAKFAFAAMVEHAKLLIENDQLRPAMSSLAKAIDIRPDERLLTIFDQVKRILEDGAAR